MIGPPSEIPQVLKLKGDFGTSDIFHIVSL